MSYTVKLGNIRKLVLVGSGGTGSLVADGLCRLLLNMDLALHLPLYIIDPDRVEQHNLRRQSFYDKDIGKFKSQVLAERLARQYGQQIAYSVFPFDRDLKESGTDTSSFTTPLLQNALIIGCVDNAPGRKEIEAAVGKSFGNWWLDSGNGQHSGQILLGNITTAKYLQGMFHEKDQLVEKLPAPSLQVPAILIPQPRKVRRDCAEAVTTEDQSPVINQAMATLVLAMVYRILRGNLDYMAAYIDLQSGNLYHVPAVPETVSRMFGMEIEKLLKSEEKVSGDQRLHMPIR